MRARRRKAANAPQPTRAGRPLVAPQPEIDGLNRALLGLEDEGAGRAGAAAEGSMQDPLQDWPEAEGEPDRWVLERGALEGDQEER